MVSSVYSWSWKRITCIGGKIKKNGLKQTGTLWPICTVVLNIQEIKLTVWNTVLCPLLWNLKIHYTVCKSPPPDPILSQINSIQQRIEMLI